MFFWENYFPFILLHTLDAVNQYIPVTVYPQYRVSKKTLIPGRVLAAS